MVPRHTPTLSSASVNVIESLSFLCISYGCFDTRKTGFEKYHERPQVSKTKIVVIFLILERKKKHADPAVMTKYYW